MSRIIFQHYILDIRINRRGVEKNLKKIWKNKYQIIEHLGTGGNGTVYQVWDLHLEKIWAMKILEEKICVLSDYEREEEMDELTALKKISHPNFPRIVDAFEEDGRSILIMDYIQGITLETMIEISYNYPTQSTTAEEFLQTNAYIL